MTFLLVCPPWLHFANSLLHVLNKAGSTQRHPLMTQSQSTANSQRATSWIQTPGFVRGRERISEPSHRGKKSGKGKQFNLNDMYLIVLRENGLISELLLWKLTFFAVTSVYFFFLVSDLVNVALSYLHTLQLMFLICDLPFSDLCVFRLKNFFRKQSHISTMKFSSVLVFAFILPFIRAQVPHWGPCPEPAVQPAFNLRQVRQLCTEYYK